MLNRDSQFPKRSSVIRGEPMRGIAPAKRASNKPSIRKIPKAFLLVGLFFIISTLLTGIPSLIPELRSVIDALLFQDSAVESNHSNSLGQKKQPEQLSMPENSDQRTGLPPTQQSAATFQDVFHISVGEVFRPVGFVVPARSHKLPVTDRPDRLYKRLPRFSGVIQKYGLIQLRGGQQYRFVLDVIDSGSRLYLDNNRNGDLTDDGVPITNAGSGYFANTVKFPLSRVTGIPQLQGDYELWLFTNTQSWKENNLRAYARTQLSGQLMLDGTVYQVYLADNHLMDADYTNDGIGIDLNGDGNIEALEYLPPGGELVVGGRRYRVNMTR